MAVKAKTIARDEKKVGGALGVFSASPTTQVTENANTGATNATDPYNTAEYNKLKSNNEATINAQRQADIASAQKSATSQLRQAFVQRAKDENTMRKTLASAGIRGGASETANLGIATNYGNTRNSINSTLAGTIAGINQNANNNIANYNNQIDATALEYMQNRQAEDRANAREDKEIAYQHQQDALDRQLQADQIAYDRAKADEQAQIDKYTAKYSKYYSIDKLKALLKNATGIEAQIINTRIGYLRQQKKGY